MERGIISLTNQELASLQSLAVQQGCEKQDLLDKLTPVAGVTDSNQEHTVQISEDEAEMLLDCMPVPSDGIDPNIISSRMKIQQFIARCRFPELTV